MYIVEKAIAKLVGSFFKLFNLFQGEDRYKAIIWIKRIIAIVCTFITGAIVYKIGSSYQDWRLTAFYMFVFGALRINRAEHTEVWIKCVVCTVYILVVKIAVDVITANNVVSVLNSILISLFFRKWDNNEQVVKKNETTDKKKV